MRSPPVEVVTSTAPSQRGLVCKVATKKRCGFHIFLGYAWVKPRAVIWFTLVTFVPLVASQDNDCGSGVAVVVITQLVKLPE